MPEPKEEGQWYTNKDLFEMIRGLGDDMSELRGELQETARIIKQYNGLRERIEAIEEQAKGRAAVGKGIREWGGWVFGIVGSIVGLAGLILALRRG